MAERDCAFQSLSGRINHFCWIQHNWTKVTRTTKPFLSELIHLKKTVKLNKSKMQVLTLIGGHRGLVVIAVDYEARGPRFKTLARAEFLYQKIQLSCPQENGVCRMIHMKQDDAGSWIVSKEDILFFGSKKIVNLKHFSLVNTYLKIDWLIRLFRLFLSAFLPHCNV